MDESYAEVGTEVILGKHVMRRRGKNWTEAMDVYVGVKVKITGLSRGFSEHRDLSGCLCCKVDLDHGEHDWRVESMILASDVPLLTPEQRAKLRIQDG